ncbi:MAG TPA: hypothetical protein DD621_03235 [Clostridiales bacterium]|nr:hypothetical protein [Clostridiales bacterium]
MDSKDIDWDEVMKDWDVWIERTRLVEEQIRKERQKPITAEEFMKAQERVLKFLKENGMEDRIVYVDDDTDNQSDTTSQDKKDLNKKE